MLSVKKGKLVIRQIKDSIDIKLKGYMIKYNIDKMITKEIMKKD